MPRAIPIDVKVPALARGAHRLGDAEIGDHGLAVLDEHVLRLDVPMHEALPVGIPERPRDPAHDLDGIRHRELSLPGQAGAQRLAGHVRHGVVEQAAGGKEGLAGREDGHDVGMLQAGGHLDLAPEPIGAHAAGELGRDDLDHDPSAQRLIGREEHARHAAAAELALNGEGARKGRLQVAAEGIGHGGAVGG